MQTQRKQDEHRGDYLVDSRVFVAALRASERADFELVFAIDDCADGLVTLEAIAAFSAQICTSLGFFSQSIF